MRQNQGQQMASQSLYRKWRSQTFSDLIGQEAVTRTLLNAVRDGRLAHAYLFCGPRGTGKTSAARLLAKAVNCATPHNGEPCNECLSCREITGGRSPDVIEIDAASNTGIDNIRDIRDSAALMGSGGHYKVYVVDEVHMLSTQAFNALLKTLEEPPPHVIFVLATTEAHKVLATVVSRCQRFDFRRHTMRNIVARLDHIAQGEGLALDPAAAELLARSAQGGMRDAVSLLDQAVAFCGDQITYAGVRGMLGLADAAALRTLIAYVAARRPAEGLDLINDLVASGADLRQLNAQLIEEWRALMLARAGADVARLMDRTDDDAREIAALGAQFTLDQLMACARIFTRNEGPARGLPIPQLALELVFLECVSVCDPTRPAAIVEAALAPHISPALPAHAAASAHATPSAAYTPNTPAASTTAYTPAYMPPTPSAPPAAAQPTRPQPPAVSTPRATPPTLPVTTLDLASIDRGSATSASITPTPFAAPVQAGATPATHGADDIANDEWGDTGDYDDPGTWDEAVGDMPAAPTVAPVASPVVYDESADDVDEP
ncbi:MAG TPA: DNA polymerase III subunit gamma/tau, partial [Ktedonobacterales bacterium]